MMRGEIIGKKMEVIESKNKDLVGLHGKVVDETQSALVIDTNGIRRNIMKKGSTFNIEGKEVVGDTIAIRPEDRVKA